MNRAELEWNPLYELGNDEVDSQHRYLFQLAEDILDANQDEAKDILIKLYSYTEVHFKQEEKLMAEYKYPGLEEHQKLHRHLIHDLNESCRCGIVSKVHLASLVTLMMRWVKKHILEEDMKFGSYLKRTRKN
jgi:hemerythrin